LSIHRLTPRSRKPTSTARAGSGSTVLVPFGNRCRQPAKIGPAALTSGRSSANAAIRPERAATAEPAADRSPPGAVIIDFAQARRSGRAARVPEEALDERQTVLRWRKWR
jgi:hypothetical protein